MRAEPLPACRGSACGSDAARGRFPSSQLRVGGPPKTRLQTARRALQGLSKASARRRKHFPLFGGVFLKGFVHILYAFLDFETILWAVSVVVGSFAGAVRSLPRPYLFRAATKHFSLCLRPSAHAMWK